MILLKSLYVIKNKLFYKKYTLTVTIVYLVHSLPIREVAKAKIDNIILFLLFRRSGSNVLEDGPYNRAGI